jgi:ADP-dependent NAD(P)H-hydrate dehydratase / NAD(P)H-hydrate epimerase
MLTPDEMGAADRRAIAGGTPEAVLVERAGTAVARHALRMLGATYGRRVVVVCGKGNNGADGYVAARVLAQRGIGVDVFALADGITEHALRRSLQRADLVIDAMFGTGFRGVLDGDAALVAFSIRAVPTLAVDIPSGVDGFTGETRGPAVEATETITFAALKPGLTFEPGRAHARIVYTVDIGIAPGETALHLLEASDCWLPHRAQSSHKWTAGALVIGGSTGMIGAPVMASHAAGRSGAGMVVCALPGGEAAARASTGELVARALPATSDGALDADAAGVVLKDVDRFHAVAIGPGLGRDERTQAAVRQIVAECPTPIIVDADALNALAVDFAPLRARHAAGLPPAILTPHAGEYARLAGAPLGADRVGAARDLAARTHAIVLLKGPGTVIAAPAGNAVVNPTDIPALAAAGTGDVLTGIITGICANGATPFAAAATGAFVHGLAAREAGTGDELVATDLITALHPTFTALRAETNSLSA